MKNTKKILTVISLVILNLGLCIGPAFMDNTFEKYDKVISNFEKSLNKKTTDNTKKLQIINDVITKLQKLKNTKPKLKSIIEYLISRLEKMKADLQVTDPDITNIFDLSETPDTPSTSNLPNSLVQSGVTNTNNDLSCKIFPDDNPWNTDISNFPVHSNSANFISRINSRKQFLHADFGWNGEYGIPFVVVPKDQPKVPINILDYPDESDSGNYPIPLNAPVEWWSDRHVIAVDKYSCKLYELYNAQQIWNWWQASQATTFDLTTNKLRPEKWTSADAAGLPIYAWLARCEDITRWYVNHTLRFTVSKTQRAYIHPATHYASSITDTNEAPMWLRFRLKKDFDTSKYYWQSKIILEWLKKYGMIVADNGSDWFITWEASKCWNDDDLNQLKKVPGNMFEVVETGEIIK